MARHGLTGHDASAVVAFRRVTLLRRDAVRGQPERNDRDTGNNGSVMSVAKRSIRQARARAERAQSKRIVLVIFRYGIEAGAVVRVSWQRLGRRR